MVQQREESESEAPWTFEAGTSPGKLGVLARPSFGRTSPPS